MLGDKSYFQGATILFGLIVIASSFLLAKKEKTAEFLLFVAGVIQTFIAAQLLYCILRGFKKRVTLSLIHTGFIIFVVVSTLYIATTRRSTIYMFKGFEYVPERVYPFIGMAFDDFDLFMDGPGALSSARITLRVRYKEENKKITIDYNNPSRIGPVSFHLLSFGYAEQPYIAVEVVYNPLVTIWIISCVVFGLSGALVILRREEKVG